MPISNRVQLSTRLAGMPEQMLREMAFGKIRGGAINFIPDEVWNENIPPLESFIEDLAQFVSDPVEWLRKPLHDNVPLYLGELYKKDQGPSALLEFAKLKSPRRRDRERLLNLVIPGWRERYGLQHLDDDLEETA